MIRSISREKINQMNQHRQLIDKRGPQDDDLENDADALEMIQ